MKEKKINSLDELDELARDLLKDKITERCFLFLGEMGVGKTTFIKAIAKQMKVEDDVTSPTYSIVNEYYSKEYGVIYHFDFYRLKDDKEAMDIGIDEYLYSGNYCLMEWPEKIVHLLPESFVEVKMCLSENDTRHISY